MKNDAEWTRIKDTLKNYLTWAITSIFDAIFLSFWVFIQWGGEKVLEHLQLSGIEYYVLRIIQVLFAIATLAPIALYIYSDVTIMALKAQRKIREEVELGKGNERNI